MTALPRIWKLSLLLAVCAALFAGAFFINQFAREIEESEAVKNPRRVKAKIVELGTALAESQGIKELPAQPVQWYRRAAVYGRVVANPRANVEVRAPYAGMLRDAAERPWPTLAALVTAGQVLGWLDIRLSPQEKLDLITRHTEAQLKARGSEEIVAINQERVQRLQGVAQSLARAELDVAVVQLAEAKTQLATARAAVKLWSEALAEINRHGDQKPVLWSMPLFAPAQGEVTELTARPGMALEAGATLLRLVDFRKLLVRIDLPAELAAAGPPIRLELSPLADHRTEWNGSAPTFPGKLLGAAAQVDTATQLAGFLYEVSLPAEAADPAKSPLARHLWRPGLFVKSWAVSPNEQPVVALKVPGAALLYHQGRTLVYVRVSPGHYQCREVQVLGCQGDEVAVTGDVAAEELVVCQRAQVLLAEEFRAQDDDD